MKLKAQSQPPAQRERMTEHFAREEFACPCCGQAPIAQTLASALEGLRGIVGVAIRINSGYRCEAHNKAIGGEPHSKHCQGIAADISAECGWRKLYEAALRIPAISDGGIGLYPDSGLGFIHVDVRPQKARWARIKGRYVGIEQALV